MTVISGASGTGKGTVCKSLLEDLPEMFLSISATTRQPRPGEVDGREYFFLTEDTFKTWTTEDKFLEYAEVYGNFYGTPAHIVDEKLNAGIDVLLEIDVQGALNVMKKCPDGIYIFLLPPSIDELVSRIKNRGTESDESLQRRIKSATSEIAIGKNYQYIVINDSVESAVEKIKMILAAERCKVSRNENFINSLCKKDDE